MICLETVRTTFTGYLLMLLIFLLPYLRRVTQTIVAVTFMCCFLGVFRLLLAFYLNLMQAILKH